MRVTEPARSRRDPPHGVSFLTALYHLDGAAFHLQTAIWTQPQTALEFLSDFQPCIISNLFFLLDGGLLWQFGHCMCVGRRDFLLLLFWRGMTMIQPAPD